MPLWRWTNFNRSERNSAVQALERKCAVREQPARNFFRPFRLLLFRVITCDAIVYPSHNPLAIDFDPQGEPFAILRDILEIITNRPKATGSASIFSRIIDLHFVALAGS